MDTPTNKLKVLQPKTEFIDSAIELPLNWVRIFVAL